MYLARTVQQSERPKWLAHLGARKGFSLPLPFVPRRDFDKVAVIHRDTVLGFELYRVERVAEDAAVGSRGSLTIKAKSRIHVKLGRPRTGRSRIRGFQGIRYIARWSDIAD